MPSDVGRIDSLQILRAVAVLLVAWLHAGQLLALLSGRDLPDLGVYGIDVFFTISGFIMGTILFRTKHKTRLSAAAHFLKRRVVRIFPVYWVFAAVGALEIVLVRHSRLTAEYIAPLFLLPALHYKTDLVLLMPFSWTLIFEMAFYYIVSAALLVSSRRAVLVTALLLCFLVGAGAALGIQRPFAIVFMNPILLEFVMGLGCAAVYKRVGRHTRAGFVLVTLGFAVPVVLTATRFPVANGMGMVMTANEVFSRVATWGVSAAALVLGGVLLLQTAPGRIGETLVALGNASYSTYLVSALVIEVAIRVVFHLVPDTQHMPLLLQGCFQITMVFAVLAIGFATYRIIEWPLLRRLTRPTGTRLAPKPALPVQNTTSAT